jgi:shikimate kinase
MRRPRTIYIIGFMGSGKTTAGKKLASRLAWSFIDLDRKIEEQSGSTIPELFSKHGEDYFRNIESAVLKSLKFETNTVISTGGGTPCHEDNMDFMLSTGLTVYLKLTPAQLMRRLSESSGQRPLVKNLDGNSLLGFIEEKLAYRETWYSRAEIILEGPDLNINLLHSLVNTRLNG